MAKPKRDPAARPVTITRDFDFLQQSDTAKGPADRVSVEVGDIVITYCAEQGTVTITKSPGQYVQHWDEASQRWTGAAAPPTEVELARGQGFEFKVARP